MDEGVEKAFSLNFKRYKNFGFWRTESESPVKKFWYAVYRFGAMSWITFFTVLQILDLYEASGDLHDFSTNLCGTSTSIFTVTKSYIMLFNMRRIESIRKTFRHDLYIAKTEFDEGDREILRKSGELIVRVTKAFFGLVAPTIFCWCSIPLIDRSEKRMLPLRLWLPVDMSVSPNYEIVYVYQVAGLWIFAVNVLTIDLITFGLILQVCAQYEILEKHIKSLDQLYDGSYKGDDEEAREEITVIMLRKIAVHHQKILRIAADIEKIFNRGILVHMTCGVILDCVIGFDIIFASTHVSTQLFTQLGYMGSSLFDVFFYCLFGEQLINRSLKISEAAYNSVWYKMGNRPRKMLSIIIIRAQKPTQITAGKLSPINLSTYLNLLKLSYNLLAVLMQTSRK